MISQANQVTMLIKMQKNDKSLPKALKNEMFIFALRSTSDDQLSDLSDEC